MKTVTVSGHITLNGAAPIASSTYQYDTTAEVTFTETTYGYVFQFGIQQRDNFAFTHTVFPGTYRVTVENGGYSNLPDVTFVANSALAVTSTTSNVDLDVKTTTVSGYITLNGAAPTASSTYQYDTTAEVTFTETTYGYVFQFGIQEQSNFAFTHTVFPGHYKVTVENGGYSNLPDVTFVANNSLAVTAPTSNVDLDVKTTTVSGFITLNGVAPVASSTYQYDTTAEVTFTETTYGYVFQFGIQQQNNFTFTHTVFPGHYKVTVENGGYSNLPDQTFVANNSLAVTAATANVDLDVRTTTVSGYVTLNGAAPIASSTYQYDTTAELTFTETTYGYVFQFGIQQQSNFAFTHTVFPGHYKVTVENGGYSNLPDVTFVANNSLAVTAPTSNVDLDVKTTTVAGRVTLNGATPIASSTYQYDTTAEVTFTETTYGYVFQFGIQQQNNFAFTHTVFPGHYKVTVENGGYSNLPDQTFVAEDSLAVTAATSNVDLDVQTVTIVGYITLNELGPLATSTYPYDTTAEVTFTEVVYGYVFQFGVQEMSNFNFSHVIFPGTYNITVENGGYSNLPDSTELVLTNVRLP